MPVLNGIETTQKIRDTEMNRHTPIILMSADYPEFSLLDLENLGINEFFIKPLERSHLKILFQKYLSYTNNDFAQYEKVSRDMKKSSDPHSLWKDPEIREIFENELREMLFEIRQSTDLKDYTRLGKVLHKLKGSCKFLNIKSIESVVIEFENALSHQQTEHLKPS